MHIYTPSVFKGLKFYIHFDIVTCYKKRDHLGIFINVEFLVWLDSPFCVEHNGKSFKRKYQPEAEICIIERVVPLDTIRPQIYYVATELPGESSFCIVLVSIPGQMRK